MIESLKEGFDRNILRDNEFLYEVERIFDICKEEIQERENKKEDPDIAEYWETSKKTTNQRCKRKGKGN